jgi:trimethylamine--corrinoid protein Co-methyltransferase
MDINFHAHQTPQFRVLSDQQIAKVFQATLECLQRTGVNVLNPEARDLLVAAGARADGKRVRIPPHIIQDAIAAAPRSFTIWGRDRDRRHRMQIVPDRVYFGPGPTCTYFIDPETGERRFTRRGDPGTTARVCNALDNIDYVMGLGLISDVPSQLASVYEFAELITNTSKPIISWVNRRDNLRDIYEIALAVAGSEDYFQRYTFMALFTTFQSPLQHTDSEIAKVLWAVEHDIPVILMGGGTAGTTAPITGAGLFVIYLAGALSGLAIMQLKRRGARVCIGGVPQAMDLRTGTPAYGSPETSLYGAALSDISRYLGVPFMGTAGATEAKTLDLQAAIESALQMVISGLSGATLVHDLGFLDNADTGSLEMLVMNDEIIGMVRRIMRGVEVDDDTLMLDLIDEIGPAGEFMSTEETARRCRNEIWVPKLMDRQRYPTWEAAGATTMTDRIRARLHKILAQHTPPLLSVEITDKIQAVLDAAEARLAEYPPD